MPTPHTEHDSKTAPVEGCVECAREVYRREHLCFGEGSSTKPVPKPVEPPSE